MGQNNITPLLSENPDSSDTDDESNKYLKRSYYGINIPQPPNRLLLATLLMSFGTSAPFGFSLAVINIPQEIFEQFVNNSNHAERGIYFNELELKSLWSFIVAAFTLGGVIGSIFASCFAEKIGRKYGILLTAVISIFGSLITSVSKSFNLFETFIIGRTVTGFSCGISSSLLSIYLSEISPVSLRGFSGGFQEIFLVFGKLLALIFSLPRVLGGEKTWSFLMALPCLNGILILITLPFFPETPKFLRSKNDEKTENSIQFYHGSRASSASVIEQIDKELALVQGELSLKEIIRSKIFRRCLLMAIVIRAAQELTGITAITNFSTDLFETLNFSHSFSMYNSIGVSVVGVLFTSIAVFFAEHVSRRLLLIYGFLGTLICDILFMILATMASKFTLAGYGCIVVLHIHMIMFSSGPGPVGWLIVPELTPQAARSTVTSVGTFVNWTSNLIVTATFLPLKTICGYYSFLIFIIPLAMLTIFLFVKLPETKNKPVDEIALELVHGRQCDRIEFDCNYNTFSDS